MNKLLDWLEANVTKIILTIIIVLVLFLNIVYMQGLKGDITILKSQAISNFASIQETQTSQFDLSTEVYTTILNNLQFLIEQNAFIIDQNRVQEKQIKNGKLSIIKAIKPPYAELKSHNVYIVGCTDKVLDDDKKIDFPIDDSGKCWSGTGVVIKITDTETYLLTNNHVSGKGEKNVTLYIENGESKVKAEIIKQHPYVDIAVLKVNTKLIDKTEIPGIASTNIQDAVYVVGNPLGIKNVYSEGVVAGYEDTSLLVQIPCIYGNSGSGVYDRNGNLVGLVYALETYPGFLGIPMARITHSLVVDTISIKIFLKNLGLYNE